MKQKKIFVNSMQIMNLKIYHLYEGKNKLKKIYLTGN